MEEELDIHYGMKINAIERTLKDVKSGVSFGIQNVKNTSTMSLVVYALQIAN